MFKKIGSRKAQAVLEIGLLGSLILIVFSLVIGYIQRLNDDQYVLMSNFRSALKKAHDENAIVNYTTLEDRRHVDTNAPLQGKRVNLSSSNYVHWAVPRTESGVRTNRRFYYKINQEELALDEDDEIGDIVFGYNTNTGREFRKIEAGSIITTVQDVEVAEELTYILRSPDETPIRTVTQNRNISNRRRWVSDGLVGSGD